MIVHFSRAFLQGLVWLSAGCCPLLFAQAAVVISEVAPSGTTGACSNGNDWVELHNNGTESVDITGWVLHDDNGASHQDAFTVPQLDPLPPAAFLLLCTGEDSNNLSSPQFGIGKTDTITLIDTSAGAGNEQASSQVKLTGETEDALEDVTYALDETDGKYKYTIAPTPGMANIITPIPSMQERMIAQNAEGTKFFNMDDRGLPVPGGMDEVVDLHITMEEADFQYMMQNATYQRYVPFTSARVVTKKSAVSSQQNVLQEEVLLNLTSPGRIRSKGQSTLVYGVCLNSSVIPFAMDFDNELPSQTLFGVQRLYLRNHFDDSSYMREWVAHRMLARFGLPHLRARTVRFFINEKKVGLYTAMEAVDQDYVFYRSFPTVDVANHALYKVKTMSRYCGRYDEALLNATEARLGESSTPPYAYEKGEHREKIPVLGPDKYLECQNYFYHGWLATQHADAALAYLRYDRDCGAMLVEEGIIDRDLGNKDWDPVMGKFIEENLADNECDDGCQNSNLADEVDIDSFLKNFVLYAVGLVQDSPLGTGNNYYLANPGDGTGWHIVAWDILSNSANSCHSTCNEKLVHWSVLRPTCRSLESNQLVGPLLTNPTLHAKYMEYVRSFTNDVIGNTSFYEEIQQHGEAIREDAASDAWGEGGIYFEDNLSLDPTLWDKNDERFPLLPLYAARVIAVRKQLEAYDDGTFPRGPHLDTPVEPYETCVDWRSKGVNDSGTSDNGGKEEITDNASAGSFPSHHFQLVIVWVTTATTFMSSILFHS